MLLFFTKHIDIFKSVKNNACPIKLNILSSIYNIALRGQNYSNINNTQFFTLKVSYNSFKAALLDQCIDIIIHNHIETTRDNVKQTIYKTTSTEYYKLYSILSAYEHDSVNVATKLKEEWIDAITEEILQIIYNGQDATNRIRQINNKLSIDTEEYSIYINNKVFNH